METHLDPFCPILTNLFFFPFTCVYMSTYVYVCVCRTVSYCVVPCRTVSYCVVLCRTVSYCVVLCRTVSYCVVLCRTVSYCVVLCRTVSYCVVLCRTVSYGVVLCRTVSYCVVQCRCCTTPCTTLYDASYIPDASGPDALYDTVRRVVRSRRVGPRHLVRRPDASYSAFPTALRECARAHLPQGVDHGYRLLHVGLGGRSGTRNRMLLPPLSTGSNRLHPPRGRAKGTTPGPAHTLATPASCLIIHPACRSRQEIFTDTHGGDVSSVLVRDPPPLRPPPSLPSGPTPPLPPPPGGLRPTFTGGGVAYKSEETSPPC